MGGRAGRRADGEAEFDELAGDLDGALLVGVLDAEENITLRRERGLGGHLGFGKGHAEIVVHAHDFAGRAHLGAEHDGGAGEAREGEHGLLHAPMFGLQFAREAEVLKFFAGHDLRGNFRQRHADGLRDEGHGARRAGVDLEHVELVALHRELHVHQADDFERLGERVSRLAHGLPHLGGERVRRHHHRCVSRMHAGKLDVLQHTADDRGLAVAEAVDVELHGVLQKFVDEHGLARHDLERLPDDRLELILAVDDEHPAAAEHERRAEQHGETDLVRERQRLRLIERGAVGRLQEFQLVEHGGEKLPILGEVDTLGRGANDVHAVRLQAGGEVERRLPAELHDGAGAFLLFVDLEHVLERERLEVKSVGRIVVGRNRFGIRVDHHGLVADLAQCEARVHTTVIELDALANAVGAAADNHDLRLRRGDDLVFVAVARVVVRRERLELRGAGVDETERREHARGLAVRAHRVEIGLEKMRELRVGKTKLLRATQRGGVDGRERKFPQRLLHLVQLAQLVQEPRVDLREIEDLRDGVAGAESVAEKVDALGVGRAEFLPDGFVVGHLVATVLAAAAPAARAGLERTQAFLERLLERAADGHGLTDGLHRGGERGVGAEKFLEREARDLRDDVVDGRLEARGGQPRDVIAQLVERVADGELGGDLRDGETGGLGGERRGARHARIHLDHDLPAGRRINGELDVGAAGRDADLANDGERRVAHHLKFLVGERHRRCDRDRVAGVHAHRVEVLDGTDDDALVLVVAHDLHLVFLPAEQAFLDEHLVRRGNFEAAGRDLLEFIAVVGDAAAGAAEREAGADDERESTDEVGRLARLVHGVHGHRLRDIEADPEHALLEEFAVLALLDRVGLGPDHLDAVFFENARVVELHRKIERGLAAEGREERGGAFAHDDFLENVERERLDVGDVGKLRIGHDRGRIGVHQNDFVALFLERLARLSAGVIELASLPDDDGASADDQNRLKVGAFGHGRRFRRELRAPKHAASGKRCDHAPRCRAGRAVCVGPARERPPNGPARQPPIPDRLNPIARDRRRAPGRPWLGRRRRRGAHGRHTVFLARRDNRPARART